MSFAFRSGVAFLLSISVGGSNSDLPIFLGPPPSVCQVIREWSLYQRYNQIRKAKLSKTKLLEEDGKGQFPPLPAESFSGTLAEQKRPTRATPKSYAESGVGKEIQKRASDAVVKFKQENGYVDDDVEENQPNFAGLLREAVRRHLKTCPELNLLRPIDESSQTGNGKDKSPAFGRVKEWLAPDHNLLADTDNAEIPINSTNFVFLDILNPKLCQTTVDEILHPEKESQKESDVRRPSKKRNFELVEVLGQYPKERSEVNPLVTALQYQNAEAVDMLLNEFHGECVFYKGCKNTGTPTVVEYFYAYLLSTRGSIKGFMPETDLYLNSFFRGKLPGDINIIQPGGEGPKTIPNTFSQPILAKLERLYIDLEKFDLVGKAVDAYSLQYPNARIKPTMGTVSIEYRRDQTAGDLYRHNKKMPRSTAIGSTELFFSENYLLREEQELGAAKETKTMQSQVAWIAPRTHIILPLFENLEKQRGLTLVIVENADQKKDEKALGDDEPESKEIALKRKNTLHPDEILFKVDDVEDKYLNADAFFLTRLYFGLKSYTSLLERAENANGKENGLNAEGKESSQNSEGKEKKKESEKNGFESMQLLPLHILAAGLEFPWRLMREDSIYPILRAYFNEIREGASAGGAITTGGAQGSSGGAEKAVFKASSDITPGQMLALRFILQRQRELWIRVFSRLQGAIIAQGTAISGIMQDAETEKGVTGIIYNEAGTGFEYVAGPTKEQRLLGHHSFIEFPLRRDPRFISTMFRDIYGQSAVDHAAQKGSLLLLKELLGDEHIVGKSSRKGEQPKVNQQKGESHSGAELHSGPAVARKFIKQALKARDVFGRSALHKAGSVEVFSYLAGKWTSDKENLRKKLDEHRDKGNCNVLHFACLRGDIELIRRLLEGTTNEGPLSTLDPNEECVFEWGQDGILTAKNHMTCLEIARDEKVHDLFEKSGDTGVRYKKYKRHEL